MLPSINVFPYPLKVISLLHCITFLSTQQIRMLFNGLNRHTVTNDPSSIHHGVFVSLLDTPSGIKIKIQYTEAVPYDGRAVPEVREVAVSDDCVVIVNGQFVQVGLSKSTSPREVEAHPLCDTYIGRHGEFYFIHYPEYETFEYIHHSPAAAYAAKG